MYGSCLPIRRGEIEGQIGGQMKTEGKFGTGSAPFGGDRLLFIYYE